MIREVRPSDAAAICEIYNYYIEHTTITFEFDLLMAGEIAQRMDKYQEIGPYLVYEQQGQVIGYAYVSRFRERKAYENSVESTIYLKHGLGGQGIGFQLYSELIARTGTKYHAIIGGIALPNPASIRLHEKCGFKKVAHFSEVGRKFGEWIDVGFWQRAGSWTGEHRVAPQRESSRAE